MRFSTGCRARSPGKSGRGPAPGSSVHYPAVPSDARRRGAAGSARKAARTGSISRGRFFHHPRIYGERALFFCGEIMTQRPATAGPAAAAAAAAAAAVHRACYNQLSTTLQRYRAQQQQATPCACDRSALYCVELLWKAPEIHHSSHLLVPEVYLGCCCRYSASFGTTPRYMQQHTTIAPVAVGNAMHVWKIRAVRCRACLLYTSPSPRDKRQSRMPSSA